MGAVLGFQETLKALSDPVRREIVELLKDKRLPAGDIAAHFDLTGATVSHHLSVLKSAGLVTEERQGKFIYYELNASVFEEVLSWILKIKEHSK